MRGRGYILLTGLILFLLFYLSCAPPAVYEPRLFYGPDEEKWVRKTLSRMTLEEKVGQMVAWQYVGKFINRDSDDFRELVGLIEKQKIGGLILFGPSEVYETAFLTNYLQEKSRIPLLISADFETGTAMRINGTTPFPPLMALGAANSEELAYEMGKITAVEGRAVGIHMTYAPVVDVNINPDNPIINTRSLGENPEDVSRLASAFIKGCQANGLIATAKHFPGHGDTNLDSHSLLPVIRGDRARLEKVELYPFGKAIEAGIQAVMTAHLEVPSLDPTPGLPATLSPLILTELLRNEMGFKGLIVTDAMNMGGITNTYSPVEAATKSVMAGADVILLPPDPAAVVSGLIEAVSSGEISVSRIEESAKRILEAKARIGLHRGRFVDIESLPLKLGSKQHLEKAALLFENSVTLVKNKGELLPLSSSAGQKKIAVFSLSSDPDDYFAGRYFIAEMEKRIPGLISFYADAFTGQEYIEEGVEKAAGAEVMIFALFSSLRTHKGSVDLAEHHIEVVKQFVQGPAKVIALSFGSPYFLRHFPEVEAYLCFYRNARQTQELAARALFGDIEIRGRLPVSILHQFPTGYGLTLPKR